MTSIRVRSWLREPPTAGAEGSRAPALRLERIELDDLLGRRRIPSELAEEDFEADLRNLAEWRDASGRRA
jgi:hypothetical protein